MVVVTAWIVGGGLAWPIVHLAVYLARFGSLPAAPVETALFIPTGAIGGWFVHRLLSRSVGSQKKLVIVTTLLSLPIAVVGNLGGGLLGPVGVTLFGVVPIIALSGTGWLIGTVLERDASGDVRG